MGIGQLTWDIGREAWLRQRPFLLYLKPTGRCDLRCKICNRWQDKARKSDEMPLEEIAEILARFRRAGSVVLTLWGGEPTIRADLPETLAEAKRLGFRTSMCTNCNSLERKGPGFLPHLDVLLCSLDGYGEVHDEKRGVPGLFERVLGGIRLAKGYGHLDIKVWATVHRGGVDQVEPLAGLARDLNVGIEFFPVSPISDYNDETVPTPEELQEAFSTVKRLKARGYPVRNPDRALDIMQSGRRFRCNFGRIAVHLDHRGLVYSCEDPEGTPLFVFQGADGLKVKQPFGELAIGDKAVVPSACTVLSRFPKRK